MLKLVIIQCNTEQKVYMKFLIEFLNEFEVATIEVVKVSMITIWYLKTDVN